MTTMHGGSYTLSTAKRWLTALPLVRQILEQ